MWSCGRAGLRYSLGGLLAWAALTAVGCGAADSAEATRAPADQRPVVAFLGTSLTAGYGLAAEEAYPALVQERIDEAGLGYRVVNAGVSGDTSAGGLRRVDWILRLPIAVLVLELGANDMLRGLDVDAMRRNLGSILERTRAAHPRARLVVVGMRAAPNLGATYVRSFESVFPELAREYDSALIAFLLEGVAASPRLNQADGIHPTAEGHRLIADKVWQTIEPLLRSLTRDSATHHGDRPSTRG